MKPKGIKKISRKVRVGALGMLDMSISGMCAVFVNVTVDEVIVDNVVSVSDVGEAISPDGVKNQIEGGIVQSISWTLKEAVKTDGLSTTVVVGSIIQL